ncbi:MAG: hypothetical protein GXO07_05415 [Crenarchaeota archaeon]|nr:hypothetical protein [Thermoproteota archaeon]
MDYFVLSIMLIAIYLILAVADYYSTLTVLASGKGREANPLMAPLLEMGDAALIAQLVSGAAFAVLAALSPRDSLAGLVVVVLLKALVVLNNVINGYLVWSG